jgi:hypothetical protein
LERIQRFRREDSGCSYRNFYRDHFRREAQIRRRLVSANAAMTEALL